MTALSITPPFPVFTDKNGEPLEDGYIWIGEANKDPRSFPVATYWNNIFTEIAAQPIRTLAGYPSKSGSPSQIFITSQLYSILVQDKRGVTIFSSPAESGPSIFLNYAVSEEIIIATAGQTVFNLSNPYAPGTNNLTVYVDGVNQYYPGAYTETNGTTVTFASGLHEGAEVKFATSVQLTSGATDSAQVSYQPAGAGAVVTNVQTKLRESVSVKDFGAVGDGVTDDSAAIQAALDYAAGRSSVFLPRPADAYYIGGTTLKIPNGTELFGDGYVYTGDGSQIIYDGTTAAVATKEGYDDTDNSRNVVLRRVKIKLITNNATGVWYAAAKRCIIDDVVVVLAGANQTGLRMRAEKGSFTYGGNFYNKISSMHVLGLGGSNNTAYLLTGLVNNGQNNANVFTNVNQEFCNKGVVLGPSYSNHFYGVTLEDNADSCIEFLADAFRNQFFGAHIEGTSGRAVDFKAGSYNNRVICSSLSNSLPVGDFNGNTNLLWYLNIWYSENNSKTQQARNGTDTYAKTCWGRNGYYHGDGVTADPTDPTSQGRLWRYQRDTLITSTLTTASPTVTPDCDAGYHQYINLNAGVSGTVTIAAPINSFAQGEIITFEVINNSAGAVTLAWDAQYIRNASLATNLTAGQRYTVQFRRRGTTWVIMGAPFGPV